MPTIAELEGLDSGNDRAEERRSLSQKKGSEGRAPPPPLHDDDAQKHQLRPRSRRGSASSIASSVRSYVKPDAPHTKWVVLAVYCLLSASNGFQWINYAPIIDEVKDFFEMDSLMVNSLTTIYTVVYPSLIIVGCVVFQRLGTQGGLVIGAALNFVGALIKVFAALWWQQFPPLAMSQVINALAEVFFLSLPPFISATWFPSDQRTLATAIGINSNALGTAFGFIIPPAMVNQDHKGAKDFFLLFLWQAVLAALILFGAYFMPRHPKRHPSVTAAKHTNIREIPPSLKHLITCVPFLILAFASGLSNDSLNIFSSFLAQILAPWGVSEFSAGWIGFALTVLGAATSTAMSVLIDKHRVYKAPLLFLSLGAVVCFSLQSLLMLYATSNNVVLGLSFILIPLMGCFLNAQIPLQMELSVELTYPRPEGVTTAFLLCLSGVLTPVLTVIGTQAVGDNPTRTDVINFMIGCNLLSCVAASLQLLIKNDLRRVKIEAKARRQEASEAGSSRRFVQGGHDEGAAVGGRAAEDTVDGPHAKPLLAAASNNPAASAGNGSGVKGSPRDRSPRNTSATTPKDPSSRKGSRLASPSAAAALGGHLQQRTRDSLASGEEQPAH